MVTSKKNDPKWELIRGVKFIKQIQQYDYQGNIIKVDRNCDTEIRRLLGIKKDAIQKQKKEIFVGSKDKSAQLV